jgi:hypothetical protein
MGGRGHRTCGRVHIFLAKGNENHELGTGFFFVHTRIISAAKRVDFVSDRMSYIILNSKNSVRRFQSQSRQGMHF